MFLLTLAGTYIWVSRRLADVHTWRHEILVPGCEVSLVNYSVLFPASFFPDVNESL